MKKNRYRKAFESLCRLRRHRIQAARDLYYVHAQLVIEYEMAAGSTYATRLRELVTVPRIRRSLVAALVVFMGQQFCGKFVLYSPGS
jgi:energy-converting hydrogenase Eha subunit B